MLVLDEVQPMPGLSAALQTEIDDDRHRRDCGLLHAPMDIVTVEDLQGHPTAGASWQGFRHALRDVRPDRACVVALVARRYRLAEGVEVLPVRELPQVLA